MPSTDLVTAAATKFNLTERQAALALAYAREGNMASASRACGYNVSEARKHLQNNSGFIAAVREAMETTLVTDAVRALAAIRRLMDTSKSERIRLDAAKALKDWVTAHAPQKHIHEHRFGGDMSAVRARVEQLLSELGLDQPAALIEGAAEDVTDQ